MRGGPTRTGVYHARRVHATDAGSGRPFRTPDPLLEPEDGPFHLRRTQQDPHHQSREDAAPVRRRGELHQERRSPMAARCCSSAPSARRAMRCSKKPRAAACRYVNQRWLGGMLTNFKTIRQSIKRLEEITELADLRRAREARQEGSHAAAPRDGQAREQPGRHQEHGLAARCDVRDRRRPREHRDPRSQEARHPGRRDRGYQLLARTASTT